MSYERPDPSQSSPAESKSGRWMGTLAIGILLFIALLILSSPKPTERGVPSVTITEDGQKIINISESEGAGPRLSVASQPSGASVLLNGRLIGATPVSVDGLPLGTYGLRLEKDGCAPISRSVEVTSGGAQIREKLGPLPLGALRVDIKPEGADVLLDGDLIGHTPLSADNIPVGPHELLIRKTNFEPYSVRIDVSAEQPLIYTGFELKDKVLVMLDGMIKSEPQRLAHYIDLGHYLFVNDRMKESVDVFVQGLEVHSTELDFNGPGFTGEKNMSEDEKELERRLRKEDDSRFLKELEKHANWPRKDTRAFRAELDQAREMLGRKHAGFWPWAERAGAQQIRARNYSAAIKIYNEHITGAPKSPDLYKAHTAIVEAYLAQRETGLAHEQFDKFATQFANNGLAMRHCGERIFGYLERVGGRSRLELLALSERALRRGLELTKPEEKREKAQSLYYLGAVLASMDKAAEAVPLLEQSIDLTPELAIREERSLRLADALRRADRLDEAAAMYRKLTGSETIRIRESAKTGLLYVTADAGRRKKR